MACQFKCMFKIFTLYSWTLDRFLSENILLLIYILFLTFQSNKLLTIHIMIPVKQQAYGRIYFRSYITQWFKTQSCHMETVCNCFYHVSSLRLSGNYILPVWPHNFHISMLKSFHFTFGQSWWLLELVSFQRFLGVDKF